MNARQRQTSAYHIHNGDDGGDTLGDEPSVGLPMPLFEDTSSGGSPSSWAHGVRHEAAFSEQEPGFWAEYAKMGSFRFGKSDYKQPRNPGPFLELAA